MARKTLLYYLFSENKLPLYVDDAGYVVEGDANYKKANGQPAHLKYDPGGWKDTLVKYARNIKYWGLFRDMTVPMKFPGDGFKILKNRMWSNGYEGICYLGLMKLDRTQLPYGYKPWYLSEINFLKYKEGKAQAQVEALEGGLSKYLKANENKKYTFPIASDPEVVYVYMDGVKFDFNRTWGVPADQKVRGTNTYYLGLIETSREGNALEVQFQDLGGLTPGSAYPNDNWQIQTDIALSVVRVHGEVEVYFDKSVGGVFRVEISDITTGAQQPQIALAGFNGNSGEIKKYTFDQTFSIPAGHRVNFRVFGGSPTDSNVQFTMKSGEVLFDYVYRYAGTYVRALPAWRVLDLLAEAITDGQYTALSNYLKTVRDDIVITSGDALRGIADAELQTSLADFFKSMNRWGVGLGGDNDVLRLEQIDYFFGSDIIMYLGEVKNAELSVAEDLVFNTIKVGGPKKDYIDTNGKYEINQEQNWSAPVTRVQKELDLQTEYRSDPLGAELMRINFEQKTTTDAEGDNDVWMLHINRETLVNPDLLEYHTLYRPAYTAFTGLPHYETSFNTELTPKDSLLSNGRYLHSVLDLMDGKKITFDNAEKNADTSKTLAGITVTQKEDIAIGTLPVQLFKNYYFTFTTEVSISLVEIMSANPYGKIKFRWNGLDWYGYLMDGGLKPGTLDTQQWKLLAAVGNDLNKFNNA